MIENNIEILQGFLCFSLTFYFGHHKKSLLKFLVLFRLIFPGRMRLWLCFASQYFIIPSNLPPPKSKNSHSPRVLRISSQTHVLPFWLRFWFKCWYYDVEFRNRAGLAHFFFIFSDSDLKSISVFCICFTIRFCFIKLITYKTLNKIKYFSMIISILDSSKSPEASTIHLISTPLDRALHSPLSLGWTINQSLAIQQTTN